MRGGKESHRNLLRIVLTDIVVFGFQALMYVSGIVR